MGAKCRCETELASSLEGSPELADQVEGNLLELVDQVEGNLVEGAADSGNLEVDADQEMIVVAGVVAVEVAVLASGVAAEQDQAEGVVVVVVVVVGVVVVVVEDCRQDRQQDQGHAETREHGQQQHWQPEEQDSSRQP